ncbi:MAG: NUDIX hydrolase N-terminal domain-containing protein [Succinivibrio sp.]
MLIRYTHVLFDLDGTIYNTEYAYTMALLKVVKKHYPHSKEDYKSLTRFMGSAAADTQRELNFKHEDPKILSKEWFHYVKRYADTIKPFDGVMGVIKHLKEKEIHLGIITSRDNSFIDGAGGIASPMPTELTPYFDNCICASDVKNPKPAPDSILKYMERTGAKREEILFIGDTQSDIDCAKSSGVDFGLAVWGTRLKRSVKCAHHFLNPWDIISAVFYEDNLNYQWFKWAREIQAIGQIGLTYCENKFDIERFERLREIAGSMVATMLHEPVKEITEKFCMERGYITPKLDTRAAVFNEKGEILLVKEERSKRWSLPGGWCDENETVTSNTIKEVREEAGMIVHPYRFVGLLDKSKWNVFRNFQPAHILAAFTLCRAGEGAFLKNDETLERRFFSEDSIPVQELRTGTTTIEQIKLCFEAYRTENWVPVID